MDYKLEQPVKVLVTDNLVETTLGVLDDRNYNHPMIVIDQFLLSSKNINNLLEAIKKIINLILFMIKLYPIHL